jgi:hypothetical protein
MQQSDKARERESGNDDLLSTIAILYQYGRFFNNHRMQKW